MSPQHPRVGVLGTPAASRRCHSRDSHLRMVRERGECEIHLSVPKPVAGAAVLPRATRTRGIANIAGVRGSKSVKRLGRVIQRYGLQRAPVAYLTFRHTIAPVPPARDDLRCSYGVGWRGARPRAPAAITYFTVPNKEHLTYDLLRSPKSQRPQG